MNDRLCGLRGIDFAWEPQEQDMLLALQLWERYAIKAQQELKEMDDKERQGESVPECLRNDCLRRLRMARHHQRDLLMFNPDLEYPVDPVDEFTSKTHNPNYDRFMLPSSSLSTKKDQ